MHGEDQGRKEKGNKQGLQHLYQQGGQKGYHTILSQEEKQQCDSHQGQQASQQMKKVQTDLDVEGYYFKYEEHQKGLGPEREVRSPIDFREFGDLKRVCIPWGTSY
jgi:hypothetical protein